MTNVRSLPSLVLAVSLMGTVEAFSVSSKIAAPTSASVEHTSTVMTEHRWEWQGHPITYYSAKTSSATTIEDNKHDDRAPELVLLLNGFGVGAFHQELLIQELINEKSSTSSSPNRVVYAIDYLGQGKSWPRDCRDGRAKSEQGLQYSGEMWVNQIVDFIETHVLEHHGDASNSNAKIHLVGNSVGGHLSVHVANRIPSAIRSVTLLNATPTWGANLPGWSGHLPAPSLPRWIGAKAFDFIRNEATLTAFLSGCYQNDVPELAALRQKIHACTTGRGGHAAFASILWSPPIGDDFSEALSNLEVPVQCVYGANDNCLPSFAAQQILQSLPESTPYYEVSETGHCPNHESPRATAFALEQFWGPINQDDRDDAVTIQERWGKTTLMRKPREPLDWIQERILEMAS